MTEIERHRDTIRSAPSSVGGEGGTLGLLERAKAQVEALAYFAEPEIGSDAARVREVLLLTIEDAISQVKQDDAFIDHLAKQVHAA